MAHAIMPPLANFPYRATRGKAIETVVPNPLASVPWVLQCKFNGDGNDSIGANHLTNNSSATFTTGKLGGANGATSLNGSSQYWSKTDTAALSLGASDITICLWVYFNSVSGNRAILLKGASWSASNQWEYLIYYGGSRFNFLVSNGGANTSVTNNSFGAATTGTWYCIIAWYNGSQMNIEVNNCVLGQQFCV